MEIVLVNTAMKFGPNTPNISTLGGSETAVLMAAKELRKRGHVVNLFTPLPDPGSPDYVPHGFEDEDGVRYLHIDAYPSFIGNTEVDLLIVCRDPRSIATTSHARKRVLWMHDIATHRGIKGALEQMAWTFDEIWTVSEFHRQQVHEVTDYPLKNIIALRNGIVPVETVPAPFRSSKNLVYASRPERGLSNLLMPNGIMENLPGYELTLAMYDNKNHELHGFYEWCNSRASILPGVELPKPLSQPEMRQALADCAAYVYPTQFEETSCILARECIEQKTPFLTTKVGALPETLEDCGVYFEDYLERFQIDEPEAGSEKWCQLFAGFVKWALEDPEGKAVVEDSLDAMSERTDLYWDGVAEMMENLAEPIPVTNFSKAWSLVQDGDVIPAYHLLSSIEKKNFAEQRLHSEIEEFYPFILAEDDPNYESLSSYYNRFYDIKGGELNLTSQALEGAKQMPRYSMLVAELEKLPPGSTVVEYGCGEGHVVLPMALRFPELNFIAFDQAHSNIRRLKEYPDMEFKNVTGYQADTPEIAAGYMAWTLDKLADAVICFEVLEHCVRPWEVISGVERLVKPNGQVIITTPFGPWEPQTFNEKPDEYHLRNHIWYFDKWMIRQMFRGKPDMKLSAVSQGMMVQDGHLIGNHFYSYKADHVPVEPISIEEKLKVARHRQTVSAAIIAYNNEETILKTLNSLQGKVQIVQIAHGPSTDGTLDIINSWIKKHPHIYTKVLDAPKIEAPKEFGGTADTGFGFDHARNLSAENLRDITDWILWIDTDEYLSGHLGIYLRNNCHDGYIIPQHHFTVEPRGGEIQIDRPARLFRSTAGYRAKGKIHEHFEVPAGGPGHCFMLPNVDIGHTGYVNEAVRRDRFERNFPFLRWEHETDPSRKIHAFLWFRDMVHRMRYAQAAGEDSIVVQMAQEAEDYYKEHSQEMANFGAGLQVALQYLAEIRRILHIGVPFQVSFKMDDREAGFSSLFLDTEEMYSIMKDALAVEFKIRTSRYY